MQRINWIFIAIILFYPSYLKADEKAFGLQEKPGNYLPDSIEILNEDSVPVLLDELIIKPTLISFVYYHCPSFCPKVMEGIAELVNYTEAVPNKDYQIITISIDHNETVRDANKAKNKYTDMIWKPVDPYFWRFFTADSITLRKLTSAVGYEFRGSGGEFVHTTSSVIVTPKGMISQYFYGTYFNYMHFAMSVEKALNEEEVPTRLKTLKYCYNYKPAKNRSVVLITTIFGMLLIIASVSLFIGLSYKTGKAYNESKSDRK